MGYALVLGMISLAGFNNTLVKFPFRGNPGPLEPACGISIKDFRDDTVWALVDEEGLSRLISMGYAPEVVTEDYAGYINSLQQKGIYHTYDQVVSIMQDSALAHPDICRLDTLGTSVEGRLILAWRITDNPQAEEDEPEVRVFGNIHGDELIGCEVPLWFGLRLMMDYGTDPGATGLVDSTEIWVCPMMNPDGHYHGTRYNANGVDLNRDEGFYWDGWGGSSSPFGEKESKICFGHALATNPVLEWVYHSAAQYVNYPWDYSPMDPPDSGLIISLCQEYADSDTTQTITNGWDWYQVNGSVQDATEGLLGGVAVTVETPQPSSGSAEIDSICARSERALRGLIAKAGWGLRGIITDSATGDALEGRVDFISPDRISVFSDAGVGDYHKILEQGTYSIRLSAPGHRPLDTTLVVPSSGAVRCDAALAPDPAYNYGFRVMFITYTEGFYPEIPGRPWETLGAPDGVYQSLGDGGEIVLDMGADSAMVDDGVSPDLRVYEGDSTPEGYTVYVSDSWEGPWTACGTGTGTQDFEIPGSGGVYRFVRIVDDGGGSGADAGFDLDAVQSYTHLGNVAVHEKGAGPGGPRLSLDRNPCRRALGASLILPRPEDVRLEVFDASGRFVAGRAGRIPAGEHSISFPLKPGVYFLRAKGPGWSRSVMAVVM